MLNHDQKEVETNLEENDLQEGVDTTSEQSATEPVIEPEAIAEEPEVLIEAQESKEDTSEAFTAENEEQPLEEQLPEELEETVPVMEEEVPETALEPQAEPVPEPEPEPESEQEPIPELETEPQAEPVPEPEVPSQEAPKPATPMTKEEMEHEALLSMYEEYTSTFRRGQIKEGTVVDVTDKEVSVDIGHKSDGVIPISEFAYSGIPELHSTIMVFINEVENGEGKLLLSKKKADFIHNIEKIKQAHTDGGILNGIIRRRVKGGMIVDVLGIEAFLPGSQMSLKPIPNLDQFIGKDLSFKVVSIDEDHRNIILSRKMVMEEEASHKRAELLSRIQVDSELDGEVKNITQYGAFIDLGGIDGLLHLTDMSWGKVNHPSEMLSIGDKVKVKVIGFDPETNKISLGLKQLVPHPWENIEIKYPEGTRITGKVMSVKSFGAFVEIEPGVEGLVHISEMSWTKKISDARKILKTGDVINAIVLELDKENKRISLGMKQMDPNPWLTIEDRYPIGTVLTRKVKSLTAFGAFVEIEEGIDGLIHISDISWTKRVYHPREVYRKGQEVETVILSIDRALHRIALGVKQLSPDPWENLNTLLPVNTEVKGKISKLIPKGVLVDIQLEHDVVEGFIPISHLAIPKLEHSEEAFFIGEIIPLKVIELDMDNRRLILSAKAFFFSRDPKLQEEYIAIHEQYMRDRIAKIQKKKAERANREKPVSDKPKTDEEADEIAIADIQDEATAEVPEMSDSPAMEDIQQQEDLPVGEETSPEAESHEAAGEEVQVPDLAVDAEPETDLAPEPEAIPVVEPEAIPEPEIESAPEPDPEAIPEADMEPAQITIPEPVAEPEIIPEAAEILAEEAKPEPEPITDAELPKASEEPLPEVVTLAEEAVEEKPE
jgi:small subunit ribosomal protein S1